MFKSLADASTWNVNDGNNNEEKTPKVSDSVDCDLEEDYDIPKNRESLNALVKNLSYIVSKLKEQIQKLDETASNASPSSSLEQIDTESRTNSTKME